MADHTEKISAPKIHEDKLHDRISAAQYLGGLSPGTLAVWDCTKRFDLKPIKIGKLVRYKQSVLDAFIKERMTP